MTQKDKQHLIFILFITVSCFACKGQVRKENIHAVKIIQDSVHVGEQSQAKVFSVMGDWRISCKQPSESAWISAGKSFATINALPSKVFINASIHIEGKNVYCFQLDEPVLKMVMNPPKMDWDNISRDSIIARLQLNSDSTAQFWWYGFYNSKTHRRELLRSGFENTSPSQPVTLNKNCNERYSGKILSGAVQVASQSGYAAIREKPSSTSFVIDDLINRSIIVIIEDAGVFVKVKTQDGREGYILKSELSEIKR
ncbi:SH3 domain-containing protein [Chitinophagaceae bacterium MMS25-I14]